MSSNHSLPTTSSTSTQGFSSYSPIRTLERQYATGPVVQILVRTNANCCLPGGVESLLKLQHSTTTSTSSSSSIHTTPTTTTTTTTTSSDDPFSFLNDDSTTNTTFETTTQSKQKRGISSWAKSVAKKTSSHIERGMNNLAIKADGGKNPDLLVCALRDSSVGTTLLEMTEAQPLATSEKERFMGCAFAIPLVLPTNIPNATLSLYIKSGAALAKQKHYLLGSIELNTSTLVQHLHQNPFTTLVVPLESQVVVDGHVTLCIFGNSKFPPLEKMGWSMTDPDTSGYTQKGLFHLPLHQSYGYTIQKSCFVATERAMESSIVLPIATCVQQLCTKASIVSLQHATSVDQALYENRHDASLATKAQVRISVGYLFLHNTSGGGLVHSLQATCGMSFQRPDTMFEVELLPNTQVPMQQEHTPYQAVVNVSLYPPLVTGDRVLATILASFNNNMPPYLLGNVRMAIRVASLASNSGNPFDVSTTTPTTTTFIQEEEYWQAILPLEAYVNTSGAPASGPVQIPVYNQSGQQMATIVMQLQVILPSNAGTTPTPSASPTQTSITPATGGLVSCVGLDTLLEESGSLPILDYTEDTINTTNRDPALLRRRQQLQTMGPFMTHQYLQHHVRGLRSVDVKSIDNRAKQYSQVLSFGCPQDIPSYQDKTPKPFRPSSSRLEGLLSGIPFNVHVHSLSIESTSTTSTTTGGELEGALFHNVTCGAPSDHARGFGNIISSTNGTDGANVSTVGPVSGGLRRLEAKRLELSKAVHDAQTRLITAVGTWLVQQRRKSPNQAVHYIPVSDGEISALRWKVFEATQALHHVTWTCAVRRANVFSQALGIAMTSYLTAVSDVHKAAWPDLWVRHGYLLTFEGLLSAAGKELGMIEDASVGIAMLKMVSVVLVPDNVNVGGSERVPVANSPFLKWVQLTPSGVGSKTQYRLEIGMDPKYYMERIPEPLKNNTPVRLYPLLFQVGVDIRQWGANQEKNLKNQLSTRTESGEIVEEPIVSGGGILEDEDDDVGVTDEDVLISLNLEAFRKMNAYAHAISPISPAAANGGGSGDFSAAAAAAQIHPALATLHQHIMSSAGRMNHSILDEAASIAQSLGGGGAVFCKSGKDRTAMHVTYKSAQFGRRYLSRFTREGSSAEVDQKVVYNDATLMRTYGTRLPICEKNVGQAKYAFNALQVKFMPDMLKPPASTLAGFLKGGRVFGGGGIES